MRLLLMLCILLIFSSCHGRPNEEYHERNLVRNKRKVYGGGIGIGEDGMRGNVEREREADGREEEDNSSEEVLPSTHRFHPLPHGRQGGPRVFGGGIGSHQGHQIYPEGSHEAIDQRPVVWEPRDAAGTLQKIHAPPAAPPKNPTSAHGHLPRGFPAPDLEVPVADGLPVLEIPQPRKDIDKTPPSHYAPENTTRKPFILRLVEKIRIPSFDLSGASESIEPEIVSADIEEKLPSTSFSNAAPEPKPVSHFQPQHPAQQGASQGSEKSAVKQKTPHEQNTLPPQEETYASQLRNLLRSLQSLVSSLPRLQRPKIVTPPPAHEMHQEKDKENKNTQVFNLYHDDDPNKPAEQKQEPGFDGKGNLQPSLLAIPPPVKDLKDSHLRNPNQPKQMLKIPIPQTGGLKNLSSSSESLPVISTLHMIPIPPKPSKVWSASAGHPVMDAPPPLKEEEPESKKARPNKSDKPEKHHHHSEAHPGFHNITHEAKTKVSRKQLESSGNHNLSKSAQELVGATISDKKQAKTKAKNKSVSHKSSTSSATKAPKKKQPESEQNKKAKKSQSKKPKQKHTKKHHKPKTTNHKKDTEKKTSKLSHKKVPAAKNHTLIKSSPGGTHKPQKPTKIPKAKKTPQNGLETVIIHKHIHRVSNSSSGTGEVIEDIDEDIIEKTSNSTQLRNFVVSELNRDVSHGSQETVDVSVAVKEPTHSRRKRQVEDEEEKTNDDVMEAVGAENKEDPISNDPNSQEAIETEEDTEGVDNTETAPSHMDELGPKQDGEMLFVPEDQKMPPPENQPLSEDQNLPEPKPIESPEQAEAQSDPAAAQIPQNELLERAEMYRVNKVDGMPSNYQNSFEPKQNQQNIQSERALVDEQSEGAQVEVQSDSAPNFETGIVDGEKLNENDGQGQDMMAKENAAEDEWKGEQAVGGELGEGQGDTGVAGEGTAQILGHDFEINADQPAKNDEALPVEAIEEVDEENPFQYMPPKELEETVQSVVEEIALENEHLGGGIQLNMNYDKEKQEPNGPVEY